MKKLFAAICASLTLAACAAVFASCGKGVAPEVETSPEKIAAAIKEKLGDGYQCDGAVSEDSLTSSYGLDTDKISSYFAEESSLSFLHPDVVIILEVKDGYSSTAVEALNGVLEQRASYSYMYDVEIAKVQGTRLYQRGNYVALITAGASADAEADDEAEAKLAAEEYKKVDEAWKEIFGSVPENKAVIPDLSGEWEIMPQE